MRRKGGERRLSSPFPSLSVALRLRQSSRSFLPLLVTSLKGLLEMEYVGNVAHGGSA